MVIGNCNGVPVHMALRALCCSNDKTQQTNFNTKIKGINIFKFFTGKLKFTAVVSFILYSVDFKR